MSSHTSIQQANTSRRSHIAFLKLVAFTGVVLDVVFHWLESGTWMGLLAFLIDGVEVENQNLHGGISFTTMQFISVLAHAGFVAGLMALLLTPFTPGRGNLLSGVGQMLELPTRGRGKWLTYGSVTVLVLLGIVLVGLSLKGTNVI